MQREYFLRTMLFLNKGKWDLLTSLFLSFYYATKEFLYMNKWQERNESVIQEFRANEGKVKDWAPLILLTTKGAKTGQTRIIPLMYVPYGNTVLAIASKGGAVKNPEWYHNVLTHPDVTVEVGNETFKTTAKILTGAEREKAFEKAVEVFPPYAEYQKKAPREIPVIALERPAHKG
jgi:deazaflavin-dependent oxidoreductase (nitroreductase family)